MSEGESEMRNESKKRKESGDREQREERGEREREKREMHQSRSDVVHAAQRLPLQGGHAVHAVYVGGSVATRHGHAHTHTTYIVHTCIHTYIPCVYILQTCVYVL